MGSHRAGFRTGLAVDIDPILSSSFGRNFPRTPFRQADVASLRVEDIAGFLPQDGVDGVVGGPPCQAFSEIGRRHPEDPRRSLLAEFFRVVREARPTFFLMENVPGLMSADNRPVLDEAIATLGGAWDIVGPVILDASDFGAPTKRRRVFVFGFDRTKMRVPTLGDIVASDAKQVCVRDAIEDLGFAKSCSDEPGMWQYAGDLKISDYAARMRSPSGRFTGHQLTKHKADTVKRFATVAQGSIDPVGKHKRLSWNGFCPTLRAGTGSDRGSYQSVRPLHPDENRVITPREAARLQGFPDDFIFHDTVWHSFRMIGNSVSPIIAEALLTNIRAFLPNRDADEHDEVVQPQILEAV